MGFDLFEPIFHGVERGAIVDCVRHDDAHGSAIVGLRDGFEPFLSCGIPDLHANLLAVDFYGFDLEVDA